MKWLTLTLVLVGVSCVRGQGKVPYDWLTAPYDNDAFNVRVHYTDDAVLECNDSRVDGLQNPTYQMWITPELNILKPGEEDEFDTLDGKASWSVSVDGYYLNINLTHDRHFGMYYCLLEDSTGKEWVVKTALNYKGAYWGNLWYRYEKATIYSIVGSVVCALICIIGAFIWTRLPERYEELPPEEDNFDTILSKLGYDNLGEDNNGYEPDAATNGKPSSDMQIRERSTAKATAHSEGSHDNQEASLSYTSLTKDNRESGTANTSLTAPSMDATYATISPKTDPIMSVPQRPDSPVQNDEPPAPYETVVEINGTAKALGEISTKQENIDMSQLDTQVVPEVGQTEMESVKL